MKSKKLFSGLLLLIPFIILNVSVISSQTATNVKDNSHVIFLAHDFFFTLSANYELDFSIKENLKLGLRAGLGRDYGNLSFTGIGGATLVIGKKKHFFEGQLGYQHPFYYSEEGPDPPNVSLMAGYRRIGDKGYIFKVYGEFIPDVYDDPEGFGSLPFIGLAIGRVF